MEIRKIFAKISCIVLASTIFLTGQAFAKEVDVGKITVTASAVDKVLGYASNYDMRLYKFFAIDGAPNAVKLLNLNSGAEYSANNVSTNYLRALGYLASRGGLANTSGDIIGKMDGYRLFPNIYKVSFDLDTDDPNMDIHDREKVLEQATQLGTITYACADSYIYQMDSNDTAQRISAYRNIGMYNAGDIEQNREEIKEHIVKYGAVAAKIYRNGERYFKWASGGTLEHHTETEDYGDGGGWSYSYYTRTYTPLPDLQYYCRTGNLNPNHEVLIIGWDDDYNIIGAPGKGAYLVLDSTKFRKTYYKNNYRYENGRYKGWGFYGTKGEWVQENGQWWYKYNPDLCITNFYYVSYYDYYIESEVYGIKTINNMAASKAPYQWDTYGMSTIIEGDFGANVFVRNTKTPEVLTSISVANMYDMKYEIYVNPLNESLKSENLIKVAETDVLEAGYNTINLNYSSNSGVFLTGDKFAVVIRYISPDINKRPKIGVQSPVEVTYKVNGSGSSASASLTSKSIPGFEGVTSAQGRSFIGTSLSSWTDLHSQSNTQNMYICIKAFTEEVPGYKIPIKSMKIQKRLDNGQYEDVGESVKIIKGDVQNLKVEISPSDCDPSYKEMTWQSDNRNVATVDKDGNVTAVGAGVATITARVNGMETIYVKCKVDVRVPVDSFKLNHSSVQLLPGETNILAGIIGPKDATVSKVEWASGNENVVIVTDEGLLIGLKKGKTAVTAILRDPDGNVIKGSDGKTIVAYCNVEVPESLLVDVTGITLNKGNLSLQQDTTAVLKATLIPEDATNTSVLWSSSNTNVAVVNSNGLVRAIAPGTAVITATTSIGEKTATCNVTVTEKIDNSVKSISLNKSSVTLEKDGRDTLVATITPTNADDKTITWRSSNYNVADVDDEGKITGIEAGTATITAETANGRIASCVVTVTSTGQTQTTQLTDISLDITGITMKKNDEQKLNVIFEPENAENQNVVWSSSDDSIAIVNAYGLVKAKNIGTATITVETEDGKIKKTCVVEVEDEVKVTDIIINKETATIIKGRSIEIKAEVVPENATNKDIEITISDESIISMSPVGVKGLKVGTATITFMVSRSEEDGGNITKTCTIVVQDVPEDKVYVDSPVYEVDNENNEITGVNNETTVEELKEQIKTEEGTTIVVKDKDGNTIDDTEKVGSGATIEITKPNGETPVTEIFTVIVEGDITGDGELTVQDLTVLRKYLLGNLETNSYFNMEAADLNGDGVITITDFSKLKEMFMIGGNE